LQPRSARFDAFDWLHRSHSQEGLPGKDEVIHRNDPQSLTSIASNQRIQLAMTLGKLPMRDIRADLRERLAAVAGRYADEMAEFDRQMDALQARHRERITALERERATLEQLLSIEDRRSGADNQPVLQETRPRLVPLADFLVTKAHAHGPLTKEDLRTEASLAGYFRDGNGRTFHTTLMNITRHRRLIQLPDGRYSFPQHTGALLFGVTQPETEEVSVIGIVDAGPPSTTLSKVGST
jgi:hypothetical protein